MLMCSGAASGVPPMSTFAPAGAQILDPQDAKFGPWLQSGPSVVTQRTGSRAQRSTLPTLFLIKCDVGMLSCVASLPGSSDSHVACRSAIARRRPVPVAGRTSDQDTSPPRSRSLGTNPKKIGGLVNRPHRGGEDPLRSQGCYNHFANTAGRSVSGADQIVADRWRTTRLLNQ
jgi:hypothetical protein